MSELSAVDIGKNYLEHHGIQGQKWGVQNGPPYPLDPEDHSAAEKKASKYSKGVNKLASDAISKHESYKKDHENYLKGKGSLEKRYDSAKESEKADKKLEKYKRSKSLTYSKSLEKERERWLEANIATEKGRKQREKAYEKYKILEKGRDYIEKIWLDGAKPSDFSKKDRNAGYTWLRSTNYNKNRATSQILFGIGGALIYSGSNKESFKAELSENRNTRRQLSNISDLLDSESKKHPNSDTLTKKEKELISERERLKRYLNQY